MDCDIDDYTDGNCHNIDPDCPSCGKPIYWSAKLYYKDRLWHKICFRCCRCHQSLLAHLSGKTILKSVYLGEDMSLRCYECNKEFELQSLGKQKYEHYHNARPPVYESSSDVEEPNEHERSPQHNKERPKNKPNALGNPDYCLEPDSSLNERHNDAANPNPEYRKFKWIGTFEASGLERRSKQEEKPCLAQDKFIGSPDFSKISRSYDLEREKRSRNPPDNTCRRGDQNRVSACACSGCKLYLRASNAKANIEKEQINKHEWADNARREIGENDFYREDTHYFGNSPGSTTKAKSMQQNSCKCSNYPNDESRIKMPERSVNNKLNKIKPDFEKYEYMSPSSQSYRNHHANIRRSNPRERIQKIQFNLDKERFDEDLNNKLENSASNGRYDGKYGKTMGMDPLSSSWSHHHSREAKFNMNVSPANANTTNERQCSFDEDVCPKCSRPVCYSETNIYLNHRWHDQCLPAFDCNDGKNESSALFKDTKLTRLKEGSVNQFRANPSQAYSRKCFKSSYND